MLKYEIVLPCGNKSARIYRSYQLSLAEKHAKLDNGKVIDRNTGKIVFDSKNKG